MPEAQKRSRVAKITKLVAVGLSVVVIATITGLIAQPTPLATGARLAATATSAPTAAAPESTAASVTAPATDEQDIGQDVGQITNVVLLLADDLSWPMFTEVPRLAALTQAGTTLTNFVVTESLCCPSRVSILRSQYVHNHRVDSNVPQTGGGWEKFYQLGQEKDNLPTWLSAAGVTTAHIGKYLNGFQNRRLEPTYLPPGWDHFVTAMRGAGSPYDGYNYQLDSNGVISQHYAEADDFLEDVLTAETNKWLETAKPPFYLEFTSYLPHGPAPSAVRNLGSRAGAQAPRSASFNAIGTDEPAWLAALPRLGPKRMAKMDRLWTRRLESAETLADSFDAIMARLRTTGHLDDTLVIITSDNGYHLGTHRLPAGKRTPYREDSVVPAVFIGPGITAGGVVNAMTSTIDLAPTIASLLGAAVPEWVDGRDLLPLIAGAADAVGSAAPPWRTGVLTENLKATLPGDP
ncbi:MAG: sulfatase, partial [Actinomycetota bacterium]|nr:sulfatase [Actinomycetota bacterium]